MKGSDIFGTIGRVFVAPLDWFVDCLDAVGMTEIYLAVVFVMLAVSLLLKPLRGDNSNNSKVGDD